MKIKVFLLSVIVLRDIFRKYNNIHKYRIKEWEFVKYVTSLSIRVPLAKDCTKKRSRNEEESHNSFICTSFNRLSQE